MTAAALAGIQPQQPNLQTRFWISCNKLTMKNQGQKSDEMS